MSNTLYLVRMDTIRKKSKGADAAIAEWLLSHADAAANLTLQELAEETHTAYATVCRFFKKLGLSGFREFRKLYAAESEKRKESAPELPPSEAEDAPFERIVSRIADFAGGVIASLPHFLQKEDMETAASLMRRASLVHFLGLGTSAVTARYAYTKFFRLNPACSCETDTILSKMRAAQMKQGDVLFAISSSGRTKSILEIARLAQENGAAVIALTDFENSPLAMMADIGICTTVRDSNKYIDTDFPLIQGQVTVIDILYAYMCSRTPAVSTHMIEETRRAVSEDKLIPTK